jgi:magnesium transporter
MRIWRYVDGVAEYEKVDLTDLHEAIDPDRAVVWVDTDDPSEQERDLVTRELGLAPLVVEALTNPQPQRTKLLRYGDYWHVAVHDCEYRGVEFESREIDVVVGPGWLLTVRHPNERIPALDIEEVAHRFALQRRAEGKTDEGLLLWALFDVVIDRYFDVIDVIDDRLEQAEEDVFTDDSRGSIPRSVFAVHRDLMEFRRAAAPLREVLNAVTLGELSFVSGDASVLFRDLYDRSLRVLDFIESQRDLLTGLLEADLAVISNRLNDVMKKLTSWGAILLGATLIAGIYGMNFRHMPELNWTFGYPLALGAMLLIGVGLYIIFKRKGWL